MQTFIDGIHTASPNKTDILVKTLQTGLNLVNIEMSCVYEKFKIIRRVYTECRKGYDTFSNIWSGIIKNELKKVSHCYSTGALTETALKSAIKHELDLNKKSTICLRNSQVKFQLACSNYYAKVDAATNSVRVGVTLADINYFTQTCPKASFSSIEKQNVCTKKSNGETTAVVQKSFPHHNSSQLLAIYNGCGLTAVQVNNLCGLKTQGQTVSYVQSKFNLYPASVIQTKYDGCPKPPPTEFYKKFICDLKKQGVGLGNQLIVDLKKTFDPVSVDNHYKNNC